jgi:hypothetical protein
MYGIGKAFLTKKNAQFAALLFGISTYSFFFQVSGLKETLMITLITGSFYFYYRYIFLNKNIYLMLSLIWCLAVFFFRVPLMYFIIISLLTSEFVRFEFVSRIKKLKINYKLFMVASIVIIVVSYMLYANFYSINQYSSNIRVIGSTKQADFANYSYLFVYFNSFISGYIGPLPTIMPIPESLNLSLLSGSLILRVYLGLFFILGVYYARMNNLLIALVIFCVLEMSILSIILHSFEVRKCFPHFPFMILVSMYGLQNVQKNHNHYLNLKTALAIYNPAILVLIISWNYLRI